MFPLLQLLFLGANSKVKTNSVCIYILIGCCASSYQNTHTHKHLIDRGGGCVRKHVCPTPKRVNYAEHRLLLPPLIFFMKIHFLAQKLLILITGGQTLCTVCHSEEQSSGAGGRARNWWSLLEEAKGEGSRIDWWWTAPVYKIVPHPPFSRQSPPPPQYGSL